MQSRGIRHVNNARCVPIDLESRSEAFKTLITSASRAAPSAIGRETKASRSNAVLPTNVAPEYRAIVESRLSSNGLSPLQIVLPISRKTKLRLPAACSRSFSTPLGAHKQKRFPARNPTDPRVKMAWTDTLGSMLVARPSRRREFFHRRTTRRTVKRRGPLASPTQRCLAVTPLVANNRYGPYVARDNSYRGRISASRP